MQEFMDRVLTKYQHHESESYEDICQRMCQAVGYKFLELLKRKDFVPGGSILFGLGKEGTGTNPHDLSGKKISISLSNCVVQTSREDSMDDIMLTASRAAKCYQYRMGVGTDLSMLRPRGHLIRNAAKTSSGAASFMELMSTTCGTVGQEGRRGALMLTLDVSHPDIREFVQMKTELGKVSNANVSVKITDAFMNAVLADEMFPLEWGGKIYEWVKARELWEEILEAAHKSAEPGLLFVDRWYERPHGFYPEARPVTTNPCSEIPLPDDDVCTLGSLYLPNFVENQYTDKAIFNFVKFKEAVALGVEFLDIVKTLDGKMVPFEAIAKKGADYRRIGLGTHGLADTFWRLGLAYGSDESVEFTDELYKALMQTSYQASVDLAKKVGPFPKFDKDIDEACTWLTDRIDWDTAIEMHKHGRRNIQLNTIAPTGSISVLSNNCSSGIEPAFGESYDRFCLGKQFKDIPHGEWKNFQEVTGETVRRPNMLISDEIAPANRVKVQAAANYWLDHSCSSTVNFTKGATKKQVEEVYFNAWKSGCQGITVYVQGSRDDIVRVQGVKRARPTIIKGVTVKFRKGDCGEFITINEDERGMPFEVFINSLDTNRNQLINDALCNLHSLAVKKQLITQLYDYPSNLSVVDRLAVYTTVMLRHSINISEILNCFQGAVAGSLPFYLKIALTNSLPDNLAEVGDTNTDINCPKGNCG